MLCGLLLLFSHCQVCLFYDLKHCSPSGSSIQGILQARILEWVAMPSSRGSSISRDQYLSLLHWQVDSLPPSHQGSLTGNLKDINSLTRDGTHAPCNEVWSANHCTTKEFPYFNHTFTTLCKWEWTGLIVYIYVYIILFNCTARASWIWVKWMEESMLPTE